LLDDPRSSMTMGSNAGGIARRFDTAGLSSAATDALETRAVG
jgi:hypothetical protein